MILTCEQNTTYILLGRLMNACQYVFLVNLHSKLILCHKLSPQNGYRNYKTTKNQMINKMMEVNIYESYCFSQTR